MDSNNLNNITESLYTLLLNLHREVFSPNDMVKKFPVPPSNAKVIFFLHHFGDSSISEIADTLCISKSNMTPIIDKLVQEDMVTRYPDPNDRRVLKVALTDKAVKIFKEREQIVKDMLMKKLSKLPSEDFDELSLTLADMIKFVDKLKAANNS